MSCWFLVLVRYIEKFAPFIVCSLIFEVNICPCLSRFCPGSSLENLFKKPVWTLEQVNEHNWTQVIGNTLKQSFDHLLRTALGYTVIQLVVQEATNWDEQLETTCRLFSLHAALFK